MIRTEVIRYEDAAERRTLSGWACKKCGRLWPDDRGGDPEHLARWCCATELPCVCGGRNRNKGYTCCAACREKHETEQWYGLPEHEWDGETPLCDWKGDTYFFSTDAVADWLDDEPGEPGRKPEDVRLVLCEQSQPRPFEMVAFLSDDLGEEGGDALPSTVEIDALVNQWIADNLTPLWYGTNKRVSAASLKLHTERQR